MNIGSLTIKNRLVTAPIAGVSDRSFRDICRAYGAALCYGEMVSAQALCYRNQRTYELLDIKDEAALRVVQISGSDAAYMAEAAAIVRDLGADLIDINMGCPVPKVFKNGEGCAHMANLKNAAAVIEAVSKAVDIPVSVKFRLGLNKDKANYLEFAKMAQASGAAAVTLHARYREQYYSGRADWRAIAQVKEALNIPVIGNGDIFSAADAAVMLEATGCDFVMPGRGIIGNPFLLSSILAELEEKPQPPSPTQKQVIEQALAHLKDKIERTLAQSAPDEVKDAERRAVTAMRSQMCCYIKGMRGAAAARRRLLSLDGYEQIEDFLYQTFLNGQDA